MKDQYLKANDLFDSENSRFWTRFNLFTGLQLLVVAGFASNYQELTKVKSLSFILIITAFIFSIFTVLVMLRSYQISMGAFRAILEFEEKDKNLIIFKTYERNSKSPMGTIAKYCVIMSFFLAFLWIGLLIWLFYYKPI